MLMKESNREDGESGTSDPHYSAAVDENERTNASFIEADSVTRLDRLFDSGYYIESEISTWLYTIYGRPKSHPDTNSR